VPDGDGYEVHLREVPADGDCFYHCMVGGDVARAKSVQHLKKVFADSLTQEDFAAMQRAADAQLEEFAWFHEKRIEDLQGLKAYAQQIGIHGNCCRSHCLLMSHRRLLLRSATWSATSWARRCNW
jgi:hypothetical protein